MPQKLRQGPNIRAQTSACIRKIFQRVREPDPFKRTHLLVSRHWVSTLNAVWHYVRGRVGCSPHSRCVCLCACWARCSHPHASERSERLAAESQGLRRQEIKHEMKTSSSLNILPSHFPISPLPLTDLKREEGLTGGGGSGDWREEAELQQGGGSWRRGYLDPSQLN